MLPEIYEAQFRESLGKRSYGTSTVKTYKSMFRRITRELDEADLCNSVTLTQYRVQMRSGSVGIFDALWGILRQTPIGVSLPSAPRKPLVVYPHPLFADVMLLGATFGNERLPDLTWGAVENDFRFGELEHQAAVRCLQWAAFDNLVTAESTTPLVPKDFKMAPMQLWQVEYIINSPAQFGRSLKKYAKEDICALIIAFATESMRLNAQQSVLRFCCDRAKQVNDRIDEVDVKDFVAALCLAKDSEDLMKLADALPQDRADDTPAMW